MISAEVSGARYELPVPPGEPVPAAVVPNDGDLTYAQISFDPASLEALAEAAMNTGDPLTEAACWNAAWRMVTSGALSGADLAGLVTRRLAAFPFLLPPTTPAPLPIAGLEVLLERAVTAAGLYTSDAERGGARAALAAASLAGAGAAAPGSPAQRALAAGFAASAHPAISWRRRARGWTAGRGRTGWTSTATCAGGCCARWRPAGSPPTRTWTPWPPRTRWPGSGTGRPAWPRGRRPRPRKRRGNWRWAAGTGG